MSINNHLKKIIWLFLFSALASCSKGGDGSWPSLQADDLWDQLAEERQQPLPTPETEAEYIDSSQDIPPGHKNAQATQEEIISFRNILRGAEEKYLAFSLPLTKALNLALSGPGDDPEILHTVEFYLSRLTSLQKDMARAIRGVEQTPDRGESDEKLLLKSRGLRDKILDIIKNSRYQLNENNK